jgi:hypothetical protein
MPIDQGRQVHWQWSSIGPNQQPPSRATVPVAPDAYIDAFLRRTTFTVAADAGSVVPDSRPRVVTSLRRRRGQHEPTALFGSELARPFDLFGVSFGEPPPPENDVVEITYSPGARP